MSFVRNLKHRRRRARKARLRRDITDTSRALVSLDPDSQWDEIHQTSLALVRQQEELIKLERNN